MNTEITKSLSDSEKVSPTTAKQTVSTKERWAPPVLKEFGNLNFVVKGISYLPLDGLQNLTP
jgi:hypothetical protein